MNPLSPATTDNLDSAFAIRKLWSHGHCGGDLASRLVYAKSSLLKSKVVVKKTTASLSLGGNATFGDLMKRLFTDHGIDVSKLPVCKPYAPA